MTRARFQSNRSIKFNGILTKPARQTSIKFLDQYNYLVEGEKRQKGSFNLIPNYFWKEETLKNDQASMGNGNTNSSETFTIA
jgi:hypothetical protein